MRVNLFRVLNIFKNQSQNKYSGKWKIYAILLLFLHYYSIIKFVIMANYVI